jgi:hypothetical protein
MTATATKTKNPAGGIVNPSNGPMGVAGSAIPIRTIATTPQLADVGLRVMAGVQEAMVLTEQLVAGILGNFAELVVRVLDPAGDVGRRHNGGLVEGVPDILEFPHGARERRIHVPRLLQKTRQAPVWLET